MASKVKRARIKLSTAILKGCAVTRPHTGNYIFYNGKPKACALGAAYVVVKGVPPESEYDDEYDEKWIGVEINKIWPILAGDVPPKLVDREIDKRIDLHRWITSRNDVLGWSRQRIARALASVGL